jgi:hypothetical protein
MSEVCEKTFQKEGIGRAKDAIEMYCAVLHNCGLGEMAPDDREGVFLSLMVDTLHLAQSLGLDLENLKVQAAAIYRDEAKADGPLEERPIEDYPGE